VTYEGEAMAISIGSDIVLDVVKAANPDRMRMAQLKLDRGSAALGPGVASADKNRKANQQFEAMILRNFVEDMMPKATANQYGEGTAGEVWRSMQADFMSQEIAKSGGVGIAAALDREDSKKASGATASGLNRIFPGQQDSASSISPTHEWPYFRMGAIGGLKA
jgi:Rod binding domain-containing protein